PPPSPLFPYTSLFRSGYGADGADLLGLADPLAPHLPGTAFYAPDAPERSVNNPMGFQWFPIPWLDGSTEAQAKEAMGRSIGAVKDRKSTRLNSSHVKI